jgi:hypothetical protein
MVIYGAMTMKLKYGTRAIDLNLWNPKTNGPNTKGHLHSQK